VTPDSSENAFDHLEMSSSDMTHKRPICAQLRENARSSATPGLQDHLAHQPEQENSRVVACSRHLQVSILNRQNNAVAGLIFHNLNPETSRILHLAISESRAGSQ
jgi:hypothetical protein